MSLDMMQITDLSNVIDNISLKFVNFEKNKDYLEDMPYTIFEDLAVVYYIGLNIDIDNDTQTEYPISKEMLAGYDISVEELHEIALSNLLRQPVVFEDSQDMLMKLLDIKDSADPRVVVSPNEPRKYILSNATMFNGAAVILDNETMIAISEKMNGDFVIIPSSRHEVFITAMPDEPLELTLKAFKLTLIETNMYETSSGDVISDTIYCFDAKNKRILSADKYIQEFKNQDRLESNKNIKQHLMNHHRR